MRTRPQNKAAMAADTKATTEPATCHKCGRGVGDHSCRQARDGWFCLQYGLEYDPGALIAPAPEPLTRAQVKTIDAYADAIAEADARVDVALIAYNEAERVYAEARAKAKAGPTGPVRYTSDYQLIPSTGEPATADIIEDEYAAKEAWETAGAALSVARAKAGELQARLDLDVKVAKRTNQVQGPRKSILRRLLK